MLVTKGASADGSVMITYTADSAGYYPLLQIRHAEEHPEGTYIEIPATENRPIGRIKQVPRTNHVIGVDRNLFINAPGEYWTWQGFINEHQLAITESTFTGRRELQNPKGLINYPMLISLALERASTAREAIDVMVALTEEYGFNSTGESISIADTEEAWVFEIIGTGPKFPPLRKSAILVEPSLELADDVGETGKITKEIFNAIREHYPDQGNPIVISDGERVTLALNLDTPQETVDAVVQMVKDLSDVNEVATTWIQSPGISPQNYLLTEPITTDEQALLLFREAERVYLLGNFQEAKPLLERFIEQRPHDQRLEHVLYYLGMIAWDESRLDRDRLEEAKHYFEQLVRMFPEGTRYQASRDALNQITMGGTVD
jgi:tetratricopeptide (TPR) repeat protein